VQLVDSKWKIKFSRIPPSHLCVCADAKAALTRFEIVPWSVWNFRATAFWLAPSTHIFSEALTFGRNLFLDAADLRYSSSVARCVSSPARCELAAGRSDLIETSPAMILSAMSEIACGFGVFLEFSARSAACCICSAEAITSLGLGVVGMAALNACMSPRSTASFTFPSL